MRHPAQRARYVAPDVTRAQPGNPQTDDRHAEERREQPPDQRLRRCIRRLACGFNAFARRYGEIDDLLAFPIDAVRKFLPLALRPARILCGNHARTQRRQSRVELFDLREDLRCDFGCTGFDAAKIAIGLVEGRLGGDQVVAVARNGITLDEQPALVDIGDHPFGHYGSGGNRHAFGARLQREEAAEARGKQAEQDNGDIGRRDCAQFLPDRLVGEPAVHTARIRMVRLFMSGAAVVRGPGIFLRPLGGRSLALGNHAANHILQRTHAICSFLLAFDRRSPTGLPRYWPISSGGMALK